MNLRILIADDQHLLRHALRILLDAEPDLEVVGEAGNVQELLHLTRQLQPDLVLFDFALCRGECADLLAEIRQRQPAVRTVILTMIENEEVIMQALRAGANGYLLKSIVPQELLNALRAAVVGGHTAPPAHCQPSLAPPQPATDQT